MKFACRQCGQRLEVDTEYAGRELICPSCGQDATAPPPQDGEVTANASLDPRSLWRTTVDEVDVTAAASGKGSDTAEHITSDPHTKYKRGAEIAKGGMGAILSADDLNIRRSVAMKVLLKPDKATRMDTMRFVEEAQITGQLEHPGIVPVHDLGIDSTGSVYYTMKLVRGRSLHEILKDIAAEKEETLKEYPLGKLLTIFQKACDAMAFAHSRKVIHRDLKPANIMVGEFGEALVMDWGLAKVMGSTGENEKEDEDDKLAGASAVQSVRNEDESGGLNTMQGTIFGTPKFMAPEQAEGRVDDMDPRTDIYALGAILYNILTLRPPIDGTGVLDIFRRITEGDIIHPTQFNTRATVTRKKDDGPAEEVEAKTRKHCPNEKIPGALAAVAMKAMATKREDRYQDVGELQKEIESYQGGFATTAEQASLWTLLLLKIKRNKLATISGLVIFLFMIGFVIQTILSEQEIREASRTAAPYFVNNAKTAFRLDDIGEAQTNLARAFSLDDENTEAWMLQASLLLARSNATVSDVDNALHALKSAERYASNQLNRAVATGYLETVQDFADAIKKDEGGVQRQHWTEFAPRMEEFDFNVGVRFLKFAGQNQAALTNIYIQVIEELEAVNPGLRFDRAAPGEFGSGFPFLYWHHVIHDEFGIRFRLPYQMFGADEAERRRRQVLLRNIEPISRLQMWSADLAEYNITDLTPLQNVTTLRRLHLAKNPVFSLRGLENLKLEELTLEETEVSDISLLSGMDSLRTLVLNNSKVRDISPLRGLRLTKLGLDHLDEVSDLSPLQGMPLKILSLDRFEGSSIEPLRGMPLTELNLDGASRLTSLAPLSGMELTFLDLRQNGQITDIAVLRNMPLKTLAMGTPGVLDYSSLADKEFEKFTILSPLKTLNPLPGFRVKELNLHIKQLEDISGIEKFEGLEYLRLGSNEDSVLEDIQPLGRLQLNRLDFGKLPAADLSVLANMQSLSWLYLSELKNLRNIRFVNSLPRLSTLAFSTNVTEIEFLRNKESLKELGFNSQRLPVHEFWRRYDAGEIP